MDIVTGVVLVVFIISIFSLLITAVVKTDRLDDGPKPKTPPVPMWASKSYAPGCQCARIADDGHVKLCYLKLGHDGDHQFRVIPLERTPKNDEDM